VGYISLSTISDFLLIQIAEMKVSILFLFAFNGAVQAFDKRNMTRNEQAMFFDGKSCHLDPRLMYTVIGDGSTL